LGGRLELTIGDEFAVFRCMTRAHHALATAEATHQAARLVRSAQHGDPSAFGQLYRRYAGMVHAIALSRLAPEDIADAVQETFFRALRRLNHLQQADAFGSWIGTIAHNVVRDIARTKALQTGDAGVSARAHDMS